MAGRPSQRLGARDFGGKPAGGSLRAPRSSSCRRTFASGWGASDPIPKICVTDLRDRARRVSLGANAPLPRAFSVSGTLAERWTDYEGPGTPPTNVLDGSRARTRRAQFVFPCSSGTSRYGVSARNSPSRTSGTEATPAGRLPANRGGDQLREAVPSRTEGSADPPRTTGDGLEVRRLHQRYDGGTVATRSWGMLGAFTHNGLTVYRGLS